MNTINGYDLYDMFHYGTIKIVNMRKTLNDINVFPVPDADTGNNLASTMQAITKQAKKDPSFHRALETISESALYGARGNSGVIFAQFVNGLRSASGGKEEVTIEEFAEMVNASVNYTYASVSNPVEGTMLTVIKDWAASLAKIVKQKFDDVKHVFEQAFQHAKQSLELTKQRLAILQKNNVVDSGAFGFVLFLQGINSYYNKEILEAMNTETIEMDDTHRHDESVNFRYCTEGLVRTEQVLNESELRKVLDTYGDSLIIAKGLNIFRIHIHTNHPDQVFVELNKYGTVISQKVDNMILDIALDESKQKTLVITDSIADLKQDYINDNNIVVLPMGVNAGGVDYFDKLTINNEILFDIIDNASEYPTTSTPTLKGIHDLLEKVTTRFEEILILSVASKLSATHGVLQEAIKPYVDSGKKIRLIDTLNNSITEGLLVKQAVDLLNEGKSLDEVVQVIEADKQKTSILVCLDTFKYAMMGGRVPKAVGKIGNFIRMRPIMTLDKEGHGAAYGMAFSKKGITKIIVKLVKKEMQAQGIKAYGLVHCLNEELVETYRTMFTEIIGFGPEYITEVSSAVAIHSGIGTVAIGYIRN
ncbi:MAG: DegV family EDD domain-containing protein [Bacilli bacterium]|nr:DegV family EDD domain-containing protein [Bacilli bacterium]